MGKTFGAGRRYLILQNLGGQLPPPPLLHPCILVKYSSVPNRSACTFITFEDEFPPAGSYFGLDIN